MTTGEGACEWLLLVGLVCGFLVFGHLMVLMDMERARRRRRGRRR